VEQHTEIPWCKCGYTSWWKVDRITNSFCNLSKLEL